MSENPTRESTPPRYDNNPDLPRCAFCDTPTVLAESRLHEGWSQCSWYQGLPSQETQVFEKGASSGCNVCSLVWTSFTACEAASSLGGQVQELFCIIRRQEERCTFTVTLWGRVRYPESLEGTWLDHLRNLYELYPEPNRSLKIMDLQVFCGQDCDSDWNICESPYLSGDTSSVQAVDTIRNWIDVCKRDHSCGTARDHSYLFPKRLLELSTEHIHLREDVGPSIEYACLSHCWGRIGPALRLDRNSRHALRAGWSIDRLPKTFHDAVILCLNLGIQYLWIDALCIMQDSANDWNEAAASMGDIYANATLTVAATWSHGSDSGLFSKISANLKAASLSATGLFVRPQIPTFSYRDNQNSGYWPLLHRAWVYQERKLSPRVVHFGKDQLYWECGSEFKAEDGSGKDNVGIPLKVTWAEPGQDWRHAVAHYSRLSLTFEKDRLPAISAVVKRMQPLRPDDVYVAGVWTGSLFHDLTWIALEGYRYPRRLDSSGPSWSWISAGSGVSFVPSMRWLPSVRWELTYSITGPTHFGESRDARLIFRGPALTVQLLERDNEFGYLRRFESRDLHEGLENMPLRFKGHEDFGFGTAEPPIVPGSSLLLLFYYIHDGGPHPSPGGMIVRPMIGGTYQRVGSTFLSDYRWYNADTGLEEGASSLLEKVRALPFKEYIIV